MSIQSHKGNNMTKEEILEAMPSYPKNNGEKGNDIEKGYHEAIDNLINLLQ